MNQIYSISIALSVSGLLLLLAVYWQLWRKLHHLHRDQQLILSRARQKAMHIIQAARDQALQIISRGRISADESKTKLGEKLDKISADQLREFREAMFNISKDIEGDALKEIDDFRSALEMETIQSQRAVAEKIARQHDQVQQELEASRKAKLAELDEQMGTIVKDVVKQVVGKIIPIEEHEKLIIKALEDAKRRHLV